MPPQAHPATYPGGHRISLPWRGHGRVSSPSLFSFLISKSSSMVMWQSSVTWVQRFVLCDLRAPEGHRILGPSSGSFFLQEPPAWRALGQGWGCELSWGRVYT